MPRKQQAGGRDEPGGAGASGSKTDGLETQLKNVDINKVRGARDVRPTSHAADATSSDPGPGVRSLSRPAVHPDLAFLFRHAVFPRSCARLLVLAMPS